MARPHGYHLYDEVCPSAGGCHTLSIEFNLANLLNTGWQSIVSKEENLAVELGTIAFPVYRIPVKPKITRPVSRGGILMPLAEMGRRMAPGMPLGSA